MPDLGAIDHADPAGRRSIAKFCACPCDARTGIVAAQIYQGGHIDLYVEVPEAVSGRVLLRVPRHEAASLRPPGTRVGITLAVETATAFRSA